MVIGLTLMPNLVEILKHRTPFIEALALSFI